MKKFRFEFLTVVFLSVFPFGAFAGNLHDGNYYGRRIENYQRAWSRLVPSYVKAQMYGGMGIFSVGTGWNYGGRHDFCETDILFGLIPKYEKAHANFTFTLKQNFIPWHIGCTKRFAVEPLTTGLYFTTIMDDEYWMRAPDKYPSHYYGFSTKLSVHVFLGQRISVDLPQHVFAENITFYYELGTSDSYLVSKFTNKYLKMRDILSFSFGVKCRFF